MMLVADCMSRLVLTVHEQTSVRETLEQMAAHDVCHLIVTSRERLLGVVCRCDLETACAEHPVALSMSSPALVILPSATVEQAAILMRESHVGFLPVVEGSRVVGVVARSDLFRSGLDGRAAPGRCRSCGTTRHLRSDQGMIRCLDCVLQGEGARHPHDELGVGD